MLDCPAMFEEMKRYVGFDAGDEAALRELLPFARPQFNDIAEEFYDRLHGHDEARQVLTGPDQVARLKGTLGEWLELLLAGPWDAAYYDRRARIGHVHVRIGLPQRYMFGAMNLVRRRLAEIAESSFAEAGRRRRVRLALDRILDLELSIMLESYRRAEVDSVRSFERLEKEALEQRAALSEARYRQIVEKAEAIIITTDPDGIINLCNGRGEEITGRRRDSLIGQRFLELCVPPADRVSLAARRDDVLAGRRIPPYEGVIRRSDGAERRVRWHFTSLPGAAGPLLCAIGLDVTDERDLELRTRRAERLASLGTMAAGLAHEIRNPLNAAHLQLTLLQRRLARPSGADIDGAREAAELVAGEMRRLAQLVDEFLQFARPQPLRLAPVDLRATAEEVTKLLRLEAASHGVEMLVAPSGPVTAEADDERIKQVLHNLVRNAIEATGRGGRVELRLALQGREAQLQVCDDGPGLPANAPIFEPFYTTKNQGTGLGLAIVHRIVADHAGRIAVDSRPGRTVFTICLPGVG